MLRYITLVLVIFSLGVHAQLSHGGAPIDWGHPMDDQLSIPSFTLDALDNEGALAAVDTTGAPEGFRAGEQRTVNVDLMAQGQWSSSSDGGRVCRYTIKSPGAAMISVQFDEYQVPVGGRIFVYDEARTTFLGAFTHANEQLTGDMATAPIPGDAVTIEYQEPPGAARTQLHVASITHAWVNIFDRGDASERGLVPGWPPSSPCQTNVACPEAADWQDPNRSVVWFWRPDGPGCNGTLLNNTAQNGKPYVLIAHHCYVPTESQWVFYFNYESLICNGDSGASYQTLTGATRKAGTYNGDFELLELNNVPPASYNVFYAGWDRSGTPPQSGATISNPLADVKKIAFFTSPGTTEMTIEPSTVCWKTKWTQPAGTSGSPLFDQNKRVVGHVVDGNPTCVSDSTLAAKFSVNWDGPAPSFRLRDWLDPANTTVALDGYDPNAVAIPSVRVRLKVFLQGPYEAGTGMLNTMLNNSGLIPLTEPYSALGYVHQGGGGGEATSLTVLDVTGAERVVDWVVVELRDKNNPSNIVATRSCLLRSNGTIVDVDGTSDVTFTGFQPTQYYVAVRHRNHLGIMTASTQPLSPIGNMIDLTNASVSVRGGTDATTSINGVRCLWSGDVNMNGEVKYTGQSNDRDPILTRIGSTTATAQYSGYAAEDVNMNGKVKYTGAGNDRDPILLNLTGLQTGVRVGYLP